MSGLGNVPVKKVVREFVVDREAEPLQFPIRPSLHQSVLLGVEIDAGEIGLDGGLDAVFGAYVARSPR